MSAMTERQTTAAAAIEPAACALCGGRRSVPRYRRSAPALSPLPNVGPYRITHSERRLVDAIVRCVDCGMVSLPLHAAPPVAYEEAADPYYLQQAAQRVLNAHHLLGCIPAGGNLLEIGCACGFLLVAARERGFTVQGIEMSAWASGYARETYGLDVQTGRLEALPIPAASFDAVVMADVIEHLPDPRLTLRHIHRVLRPGGRLLVLTPDIGSLTARVLGPHWWGLLDDHYLYFSRPSLRRLLEQEGFAVERIRALGRLFPLSHWVFKLAPYSPALQRGMARVMRALRLDHLPISINLGDQMACVARKK